MPSEKNTSIRRASGHLPKGAIDDFGRLMESYYRAERLKLVAGARAALINFSENFYRRVYPPDPIKDYRFDFGSREF